MSIYDKMNRPLDINPNGGARKSIAAILGDTIPPESPHSNMRQGEDEHEELDELELKAKEKIKSTKGPLLDDDDDDDDGIYNQQDEDDDTDSDDEGTHKSSDTEGGVGVSEALGDVAAEVIPEVYESALQIGTEFGYEMAYAKKVREFKALRDQLQNSQFNIEQKKQADALIEKINQKIEYYNTRLSGIPEAVKIKERDKQKMAMILSKIMAASGSQISPYTALWVLAAMPLLAALGYVGKDRNKYSPELL